MWKQHLFVRSFLNRTIANGKHTHTHTVRPERIVRIWMCRVAYLCAFCVLCTYLYRHFRRTMRTSKKDKRIGLTWKFPLLASFESLKVGPVEQRQNERIYRRRRRMSRKKWYSIRIVEHFSIFRLPAFHKPFYCWAVRSLLDNGSLFLLWLSLRHTISIYICLSVHCIHSFFS